MPVYLEVSFADKSKVKELGARWNAKKKKWYIPHDKKIADFCGFVPAHIANAEQNAIDYLALVSQCKKVENAVFGECLDVSNLKTDYWNFAHA